MGLQRSIWFGSVGLVVLVAFIAVMLKAYIFLRILPVILIFALVFSIVVAISSTGTEKEKISDE